MPDKRPEKRTVVITHADSAGPQAPRIPDYDLLRCIGRGAYGDVWLAKTVMGTYRAVKIVYRKTFKDDGPFEREFNGIRRFETVSGTHPGLLNVLHVGRNDAAGYFYYAMEVADDEASGQSIDPDQYKPRTLSSEISRRGRLPLDECIRLGLSLTNALEHLHRNGLIHRDIKPANIIFARGAPKLADIGLVTEIGNQVTLVYTPGYNPPEGPGKPGADVFSLGRALYVISTGKRAEDFPELPTDLSTREIETGYLELNKVLLKACAHDLAERYHSAEEMREALSQTQGPANRPAAEISPPFSQAGAAVQSRLVSIVYKSNVQPDARLLDLLEAGLREHSHQVFIDRHLSIGVKWAQEIEAKIRHSDAVIVLLSAASIQSEMVAYELEIAHEAAQQQGKPALLPVRVAYDGALSEPLGRILNPLQHSAWKGPADDHHIVNQLLAALQNPPTHRSLPPLGQLAPPVGIVPLDSEYYVVRPVDEEFRAAISRKDSIVLVKGARQMGKTSLLARGLEQARKEGRKVVVTDFQMLNTADLQSAEALFKALATSLDSDLQLNSRTLENWNSQTSPNLNFKIFIEKEILALEPASPLSRLTLAIAYATEAHLFITDVNQSPFNVGTRLTLEDFTFEQVADINRRYGTPLQNNEQLTQFFQLVGGQPYLVRRGLHELVTRSIGISDFARTAGRDEGIFGDHLRRILVMLAKNPQLLEVVRAVLRGRPCPTRESFYRLRTAGIMTGDSMRDARPRCQVYANYLRHHLS